MKKLVKILTVMMILIMAAMVIGCSSNKPEEAKKPQLRVGMECAYAPFNWT